VDQQEQYPLVTRGRMLLLSLLAACAWVMLGIFTGGTAAVADDSADANGGVLGGLTSILDRAPIDEVIAPVTTVVSTVAPVDAIVPVDTVTETLTDVAVPLLEPLAPIVEPVVATVTPVVADTVDLVGKLVTPAESPSDDSLDGVEDGGVEISDPATSAEVLPLAAAAHVPGPAAVKATAVTPDTRVASIPAAGSLSSPDSPAAPMPVSPVPTPAPSVSQASSSAALVAAFAHVGGPLTLAVASAAPADFTLPPSPTFDNDSSPD